MADNNSNNIGRLGIGGGLGLLFIGLKLGGVISWPWMWVLSPLWIPEAILVLVLLCMGVIALFERKGRRPPSKVKNSLGPRPTSRHFSGD